MSVLSAMNQPPFSTVLGTFWLSMNAYSVIEANIPFVDEIIQSKCLFKVLLGKIRKTQL